MFYNNTASLSYSDSERRTNNCKKHSSNTCNIIVENFKNSLTLPTTPCVSSLPVPGQRSEQTNMLRCCLWRAIRQHGRCPTLLFLAHCVFLALSAAARKLGDTESRNPLGCHGVNGSLCTELIDTKLYTCRDADASRSKYNL